MIIFINYSHQWWYKALSVLLVVALILAISFGAAPRANAVGVLTMTVCAGILAVMAGAGIYTVVSGMSASDIQSWLQSKLQEWDLYRDDGNIFTDLINENLFVMTVKGFLKIGSQAAQGITDFISWLVDDLSLTNNSSTTVIDNSGFNLLDYFSITTNNSNLIVVQNNIYYNSTNNQSTYILMNALNNAVCNCDLYFTVTPNNSSPFGYIITGGNAAQFSNYSNCHFEDNGVYPNFSGSNPVTGSVHCINFDRLETYSYNFKYVITINNLVVNENAIGADQTLSLGADVIGIPDVDEDEDIYCGVDGVFPGSTLDQWTDTTMSGVETNTLDTDISVTNEFTDAVEAVVTNEQPISVNVDHHMIGFTNLPNFAGLNLNSIWHYVSDAVEYASGFISWFVNLLSSVQTLSIPLYMSFTLLIVLSFIRRILL